jgi:predicted nucleic acid-binding protein
MPERKWVFDTVSLSNFLLSESIFILENRYRRKAIITSQVYDEISAGFGKYPKLKPIDVLIKNNIFKPCSLTEKERKLFSDLIGHLGKGEASCIAIAKERSAIVVTDDRTARRQCLKMEILVTGTVGILKASLLDGSINRNQADDILKKMIESGFYSPVRSIGDIA